MAVPTWIRRAMSRTPRCRTVSPEIHSAPCCCPGQVSAKPMTSPTMRCDPGGPWRHGVAVTVIVGRPGAWSRVVSQSRMPCASCPRRPAPDVVVRTVPTPPRSAASGVVEVVGVVVVREEHGIDRAENESAQAAGTREPGKSAEQQVREVAHQARGLPGAGSSTRCPPSKAASPTSRSRRWWTTC